ncbi:MAG: hypothetical protein ACLQPD_00935, partial [Desulfomonilaceae bacterium]
MKSHLQKPFDRCYWVVPNKFLAGEYPGSKDSREALEKVSGLVNCGIRRIFDEKLVENVRITYCFSLTITLIGIKRLLPTICGRSCFSGG